MENSTRIERDATSSEVINFGGKYSMRPVIKTDPSLDYGSDRL